MPLQRSGPQVSIPDSEIRPVRILLGNGSHLSALVGRPARVNVHTTGVVFVHGFAAEKTENGLFLLAADELRRRGHAVLLYDWRGLGESPGDFARTPLSVHVEDFEAAVRWFSEDAGLAPERVVTVGFSLGAAVVLLALRRGLALGGAALWSPALRPAVSMWPRYDTAENRRRMKSTGFILKPENGVRLGPEVLMSLRTTDLGTSALDVAVPVLVCQGTEDSRIPIGITREVVERSANPRVVFEVFPGASHSFRPGEIHRPRLVTMLENWIDGCRSAVNTVASQGSRRPLRRVLTSDRESPQAAPPAPAAVA